MARRKRNSLIRQRPGRPGWHADFTVRGHRFRDSLGNDRTQAEIAAAELKAEALQGHFPAPTPAEMTLTAALARYWLEHGQHLRSARSIARLGRQLQTGLGKSTSLSALTAADLVTYAARRCANLSNRSVNIELQLLRAVIYRARDLLDVATPKIDWKKVLLEETGEREHVLSHDDEELRLFAALRPDYHGMARFALLSAARRANVVELSWPQVDWSAGVIVFRIKSKKPGGELHYLPITPPSRRSCRPSAAATRTGCSLTCAGATAATRKPAYCSTKASAIRSR
jgi:integrase